MGSSVAKKAPGAVVRGAKKAVSGSKSGLAVRKPGTGAKASTGGGGSKIWEAISALTVSTAKTEAAIDKLVRTQAESQAEVEDLRRTQKAAILAMERTSQNLSEDLRKITSDLALSIKNLGGNLGDVNNRLGEIVELVVLPGLMEEMNTKYGYNFDNASPRKRFTDSGQEYAEIDLFLENGESVMAVEAKTRFTLGMVNSFIKQVKTLREHEIKAGVVGKKIYAAIAGLGIDTNAKMFALEKGIYVVIIDHSSNKVAIESPKGAVGTW